MRLPAGARCCAGVSFSPSAPQEDFWCALPEVIATRILNRLSPASVTCRGSRQTRAHRALTIAGGAEPGSVRRSSQRHPDRFLDAQHVDSTGLQRTATREESSDEPPSKVRLDPELEYRGLNPNRRRGHLSVRALGSAAREPGSQRYSKSLLGAAPPEQLVEVCADWEASDFIRSVYGAAEAGDGRLHRLDPEPRLRAGTSERAAIGRSEPTRPC